METTAPAASLPKASSLADASADRRAKVAEAMQRVMTLPMVDLVDTSMVLGVGRSCAYAAAEKGDIPSVRIGNKLRVPTSALREMLKLPQAPTDKVAA